jgi:hypothetical protein
MWENITVSDRPEEDDVIQRRNYAVWVPVKKGKNTDTHTHKQYLVLIAFPRKQGLRESASVLHYTYIHCLSYLFST